MQIFKTVIFSALIFSFHSNSKAQQKHENIKVYFFLADACRICQEMTPHINQIYKEYGENFECIAVFPNLSSEAANIQKFMKKYKMEIAFRDDYHKILTSRTGATITPEVVVWDETVQKAIYKGRINDLYHAPGKRRHHITRHDLKETLKALTEGIEPPYAEIQAIGCFINFADEDGQ